MTRDSRAPHAERVREPEAAVTQHGAQYFLPYGGDRDTPLLFYRRAYKVESDGRVTVRLQYLSYASLWEYSGERDPRHFVAVKLLPIAGAPQDTARACGSAETTLTEAELREKL